MHLRQITPPAALPVALQEARDHLRVDHTAEDSLIEGYIAAATDRLDGAEGYLGRALITQVWELALDSFPTQLRLPLPPCQAIEAISYIAPDGTADTLDPASYIATGLGSATGAILLFPNGTPPTARRPDAVTIRFTAGFGTAAATVPAAIRAAILARVAHMYEHRESVVTGETARELPFGEDDLITPWRMWAF